MSGLRLVAWDTEPLPCPHTARGESHAHLSDVLRCLDRYGPPRVVVREVLA